MRNHVLGNWGTHVHVPAVLLKSLSLGLKARLAMQELRALTISQLAGSSVYCFYIFIYF